MLSRPKTRFWGKGFKEEREGKDARKWKHKKIAKQSERKGEERRRKGGKMDKQTEEKEGL
jgi:hypothetical protein